MTKTYVVSIVMAVAGLAAGLLGYQEWETVAFEVLGGGGLAALRHALQKIEAKIAK